MRVLGVVLLTILLPFARAQGQATTSGTSTYAYTPWQPTPWSPVEWRARCDGGQRGMESGPPIRWTVEFRNKSKQHAVSFTYTIAPPLEGGNKVAATGRQTIGPKGFWGTVAIIDVDRCGYGMRTAVSRVKYGVDADSIPYAPPDQR